MGAVQQCLGLGLVLGVGLGLGLALGLVFCRNRRRRIVAEVSDRAKSMTRARRGHCHEREGGPV